MLRKSARFIALLRFIFINTQIKAQVRVTSSHVFYLVCMYVLCRLEFFPLKPMLLGTRRVWKRSRNSFQSTRRLGSPHTYIVYNIQSYMCSSLYIIIATDRNSNGDKRTVEAQILFNFPPITYMHIHTVHAYIHHIQVTLPESYICYSYLDLHYTYMYSIHT